MDTRAEFLKNLHKLHTTPLGEIRIQKNLSIETEDVVSWCQEKMKLPTSQITKQGKNFYITIDGCVFTVNSFSYTIITAHKEMRK